jgi:hypothetical protein
MTTHYEDLWEAYKTGIDYTAAKFIMSEFIKPENIDHILQRAFDAGYSGRMRFQTIMKVLPNDNDKGGKDGSAGSKSS